MPRFVRVTSEVPLSAEQACARAAQIETMDHVLAPLLGFRVDPQLRRDGPGELLPGAEFCGRLMLFCVLPTWRHRLRIVSATATEIYTNECGGPIRRWNHRLTFEPIDERRCRYTDEIELDDGIRGALIAPGVKLLFRHRHRRWRALATASG